MKYNTTETKEKYYSCYSPKLKEYLVDKGLEIFDSFKNLETNKYCFIFTKNDKLQECLNNWSQGKIK